VVKAFNNIARHLLERGRPKGTSGRIALPVAGDNQRAKEVVMRLVDELGFDPVDAGGLDESWRQQASTPVYATDYDPAGVRRALSAASPERQGEWRATPHSPGNFAPASLTGGRREAGCRRRRSRAGSARASPATCPANPRVGRNTSM
jgi:hypothetical protein